MPSFKLIKGLLFTACGLAFLTLALILMQQHALRSTPPFKDAESAERITLESKGNAIELTKLSADWKVKTSAGEDSYVADPERAKQLLKSLKDLVLDDVISEKAESASDFEADTAQGMHLTVYGKGTERLGEGIFGKQAPDFAHLYFKFVDKPSVYLARGVIRGELGEADVKFWRDRAVWRLAEGDILTVVIKGPGYETSLARSSDTWSLNGKVIASDAVWALLGQIAHLRAEDFVNLTEHPDLTPEKLTYASILLQLKDGVTYTLHLGRLDKATQRYPAALEKEPGVVWLADPAVKALLKKPTDFPPK